MDQEDNVVAQRVNVVVGDFEQSPEIDKLAAALVKFQGEVSSVPADSFNIFLKSSKYPNGAPYAGLPAIISGTRAALTKNGLALLQPVVGPADGSATGVRTILLHESGQWVAGTSYIVNGTEKGKSGAQVMASNTSYQRRVAQAAILNLAIDLDMDGVQAGSENDSGSNSHSKPTPAPKAPAHSDEEIAAVQMALYNLGVQYQKDWGIEAFQAGLVNAYKVHSPKFLTYEQATDGIARMDKLAVVLDLADKIFGNGAERVTTYFKQAFEMQEHPVEMTVEQYDSAIEGLKETQAKLGKPVATAVGK